MKAITLTQPWATLVAIGAKRVETRSWSTLYRGRIAIHAAKGFPAEARMLLAERPFSTYLGDQRGIDLPRGAIVAVARITSVKVTMGRVPSSFVDPRCPHEFEFGNYETGRSAWFLDDVRKLEQPIPCKGALGLWDVPADIAACIEEVPRG